MISLSNLPHSIDVFRIVESQLDSTKRFVRDTYTKVLTSAKALMEPISSDEKNILGIELLSDSFRCFLDRTNINSCKVGDIIYYNSNAYIVSSCINYDYGPDYMQHVEIICERLPNIPDGMIE